MGSIRCVIRFLGLALILSFFIAAGLQIMSNPAISAALLAKSNFSKLLNKTGVEYRPSASDYTTIVQATGVVFLAFSLFILLGVGRAFFSFLLAMWTLACTVVFYVDIDNPGKISNTDLFHVMKTFSIVGALLFVAGSGHRSHRFTQAREYNEKKRQ